MPTKLCCIFSSYLNKNTSYPLPHCVVSSTYKLMNIGDIPLNTHEYKTLMNYSNFSCWEARFPYKERMLWLIAISSSVLIYLLCPLEVLWSSLKLVTDWHPLHHCKLWQWRNTRECQCCCLWVGGSILRYICPALYPHSANPAHQWHLNKLRNEHPEESNMPKLYAELQDNPVTITQASTKT